MRERRWLVLLTTLLVLTFLASACGQPQEAKPQPAPPAKAPEASPKLKVAFVYVGPVGDAGWTFTHDVGRKYLQEKLPYVETTFVENVPEGADAERVLTELAEKGNKVIFATSFGYMDSVLKVAQKYPDVAFEHCSGFKQASNVSTYFGRIHQASYLSGIVAGKMSKKGLLGYVAAYPIPEVIRDINAFTLGVRSVNPQAKVKVVWTNSWYNPAREKEAALSLIAAGADVIAQDTDSPGPQIAAEEKGVFGVGYNSDMRKFAPKSNLVSPVWNWGLYYVKTVEAVKNGTWKSHDYWGPMADGIVDISPFGDKVPDDVRKLVEAKKQEIISGKLHVFVGPLKDQQGNVKVPAGKQMTDKELLEMDWFVQGVEGTIPK